MSRKGGMTGGFYDHRRSKLRFMNTIIQNTKSINTKEKVLEDVRRQLQDILSRIDFGLVFIAFSLADELYHIFILLIDVCMPTVVHSKCFT